MKARAVKTHQTRRTLLICLALAFLAGLDPAQADDRQDQLRGVLRGSAAASVKLDALEKHSQTLGTGALEFLDKKDYSALHESMRNEIQVMVSAGAGPRALELWNRYLLAMPANKETSRFREFLPALQAPVRIQLATAEQLYSREDYLGAWRVASQIRQTGSDLPAAAALEKRSSQASELDSRLEGLIQQASFSAPEEQIAEMGRVATELANLDPKGPVPRRAAIARGLMAACESYRASDAAGAEAKLDEVDRLGASTTAFRRQLGGERQAVMVGGISRYVEPPGSAPLVGSAPSGLVRRPTAIRIIVPDPSPLGDEASSADVPGTASTRPAAFTTREGVEPVPRVPPTSRPEPTRVILPPTPTPSPTVVLPAGIERRVRDAATREARFYRRALQVAGAPPTVPFFQIDSVATRSRTAEIHLIAALDSPEQRVKALALPNADRQLFRIIAHEVLEEAPELAGVEIRVALQNGLSAPVELGQVRIDAELLKLTVNLPVEDFWRELEKRRSDQPSSQDLWKAAPMRAEE